jgi:Beta/Gamma crystallin
MTHINNQTQNLFAIDAVQDLSEESAAAIQGGADLELYDDMNFKKPLVFTNTDSANVGNKVNDRISSIVVNKGVWRFFTDTQGRGVSLDLGPGRHAYIGKMIPNDSISSFQRIR